MEILRSQARALRAVFGRVVERRATATCPISLEASDAGLRVRLRQPEIAIEYRIQGSFPSETVSLPVAALADFAGRGKTIVRLEATASGSVRAIWQDGAVPRSKEYPVIESAGVAFPDEPEQTSEHGLDLWRTLADASDCAAEESMRYGTDKLQLRGSAGQVIATDGRQLLIQGGFKFPWSEDVLVPNAGLFRLHDLEVGSKVVVGRTATHVMFQTGPWTLYLTIDTESRYPRVEECIPKVDDGCTRWQIDSRDAAFLASNLPRLPGGDVDGGAVTLDLNGHACVRTRAPDQDQATEVVLTRSSISGNPVRVALNRHFLAQILRLGLPEVCIVKADTPLVCRDGNRRFVVMPLAKECALAPTEDAVRISSDTVPTNAPSKLKETTAMRITPASKRSVPQNDAAKSHSAGKRNGQYEKDSSLGSLMEETLALKEVLRDAFGRSHRLLAAIKRHRRQTRIVQSTLASLRQLHPLDA